MNDKIDILKLEKKLASGITENNIREIVKIFLAAVNDWPSSLASLEDYEANIEKFIGSSTKKENIEFAIKNSDLSQHAWQVESLTQVLVVFQYYKNNIDLNQIIKDLKSKLCQLD